MNKRIIPCISSFLLIYGFHCPAREEHEVLGYSNQLDFIVQSCDIHLRS